MTNRHWKSRILALLISAMALTTMAGAVSIIEEIPEAESIKRVKGSEQFVAVDEIGNPDELLMVYLMEEGKSQVNGASLRSNPPTASGLTGIMKKVYDYTFEEIKKIAAGNRASAQINIPLKLFVDKIYFVEDELNLGESVYELVDNTWTPKEKVADLAAEKLYKMIEFPNPEKIGYTLRADCPYELYWMANGFGYGMLDIEVRQTYLIDNGTPKAVLYFMNSSETGEDYATYDIDKIDAYKYYFEVNPRYQSSSTDPYAIDIDDISSVSAAVNTAKQIVVEAEDKTDYDKLVYYKDRICQLTSYNDAAREQSSTGGTISDTNPWQLIWVFDGVDSTTVVCEGYSKAFQYLCDLTSFNSSQISCISPTGTMEYEGKGEPHMWNIVTMDDGNNYMVDVTNCDGNSIGAPDQLFLKGSGSEETGLVNPYTRKLDIYGEEETVTYKYDDDTLQFYDTTALTLSTTDYNYTAPTEPMFVRKSLTLSGDIAVNFFMDLSALTDLSVRNNSYMEFTVGTSETVRVDFNAENKNSTGLYFGFTCHLNLIQMGDTITAVYHYGSSTKTTTYSVAQYIKDYEKVSAGYAQEVTDLVHALADFGHYAQLYLDDVHDSWQLGVDCQEIEAYTKSYTEEDINNVATLATDVPFDKSEASELNADISYMLTLDTVTSITVFVEFRDDYSGSLIPNDPYVTLWNGERYDDFKVDISETTKTIKYTIKNLPAYMLGTMFTVNLGYGSASVNVYGLSCSNSILNVMSNPDDVKTNFAVALYRYFEAANNYLAYQES